MKKIVVSIYCMLVMGFAAHTQSNFHLTKLIFHTTPCFGFCPDINLQIDSNRNIIIDRTVFVHKSPRGTIDSGKTGKYTGMISEADYQTLVGLLVKCDIDNIKFPHTSITDVPVRTIIVYHDGRRIYLQSKEPPEEALELLNFLQNICLRNTFKKVDSVPAIEE